MLRTITRTRTTASFGALAVLASLTLTGCINPVDAVVDRVLEDRGVSIDRDGDSVTITGEDGEEFVTGGTTMPDDFPAELPLPDAEIQASFSGVGGVGVTFVGVDRAAADNLSAALESQGYENVLDYGSAESFMRAYENDAYDVTLAWDGTAEKPTLVYTAVAKNAE